MPDSVGHHSYFISQPTKALQLKKRLNFKINNMNKISIDCNDCGTVYSIRVDNTDFFGLTEIRILMKVSKKKLYFWAGYNGFHGKSG